MARMEAASGNQAGWQVAQENACPKATWLPAVPSAGHPEWIWAIQRGGVGGEVDQEREKAGIGQHSDPRAEPGPVPAALTCLGLPWGYRVSALPPRGCHLGAGVPVWIHPEQTLAQAKAHRSLPAGV